MQFIVPKYTGDFQLLDSGNANRLEKWGQYILVRPDPQAIWQTHLPAKEWSKASAVFDGDWKIKTKVEQPWIFSYNYKLKAIHYKLDLYARLTPFKHTGIFPEQAANWEWLSSSLPTPLVGGGLVRDNVQELRTDKYKLKILNLFAYTGATTILLAKLGCRVTHVDASKPSLSWAKENHALNNLPQESVRWILDDALKFAAREVKRGAKYDGIIMDPPAFGHSPEGHAWKFARHLPELLKNCVKLLSPDAKFLIINAYATNTSSLALQNIMEDSIKKPGSIESGELCLKQINGRLLSTGITSIWATKNMK